MIDPHKSKYHSFYWRAAMDAAKDSKATRHKVGAIVVTPTGMLSAGWNGMPSGSDDDDCEEYMYVEEEHRYRWKTKPEVVHAERNTFDKMARQGVSTNGSILFVTRAPCFECAKSILGLGIKQVHYMEEHDDMRGVALLIKYGMEVYDYQGERVIVVHGG